MNRSTAFNIFVGQSLWGERISFDFLLNQPKAETVAAMQEGKRITRSPNVKRYGRVEEALGELIR